MKKTKEAPVTRAQWTLLGALILGVFMGAWTVLIGLLAPLGLSPKTQVEAE
jgi:heme A synthase